MTSEPFEVPDVAVVRLGDCSIDGCLRDAFTRVTLKNRDGGSEATGLLCDEHAKEIR